RIWSARFYARSSPAVRRQASNGPSSPPRLPSRPCLSGWTCLSCRWPTPSARGWPILTRGEPTTSLPRGFMPFAATTSRRASARTPGRRFMVELLDVLREPSRSACGRVAMSDDAGAITGQELIARIAGLAEEFSELPPVLGLLGANGIDWAAAALAAWMAGKTVVPMPTFFSRLQLEHVRRDAGISHVIATKEAAETAAGLGVGITTLPQRRGEPASQAPGAGMIVYTSGSTGRPKGVRLRIEQIDWQARALGEAIEACPTDLNLSLLPFALLLETITAICVPVLIGARTHFASAVAENVGAGRPADLLATFEAVQPTTAVLVPQLLSGLVAQLQARKGRAPASLRFVAVGGARVSETLTARAWELGIPVHEGYGLTECCSVVAVNRPGRRKAGTVGEPLSGLNV